MQRNRLYILYVTRHFYSFYISRPNAIKIHDNTSWKVSFSLQEYFIVFLSIQWSGIDSFPSCYADRKSHVHGFLSGADPPRRHSCGQLARTEQFQFLICRWAMAKQKSSSWERNLPNATCIIRSYRSTLFRLAIFTEHIPASNGCRKLKDQDSNRNFKFLNQSISKLFRLVLWVGIYCRLKNRARHRGIIVRNSAIADYQTFTHSFIKFELISRFFVRNAIFWFEKQH